MPFHQPDQIRYYTFESLEGVPHAVFTRRGGVSQDPWSTLNVGGTVGDDENRVTENRRRVFASLMCNEEAVFDAWQVHSDVVVCTDRPRLKNEPHSKADAILTDQPGITLFMRFADCVPILLWDPGHKVIGLVHAGWQGTVKFTASRAIEAMQDQYGSRPAEIIAAIGPSIAAHHYPVGEDVTREIRQKFGQDAGELLSIGSSRQGPQETLDLWKANQLILERAGVDKVELANLCTACHLDDWYSHRAESGKTGRFGVLIRLP